MQLIRDDKNIQPYFDKCERALKCLNYAFKNVRSVVYQLLDHATHNICSIYPSHCLITVRNGVAKVMFSQTCVCPQGGACSRGRLLWGSAWSEGGVCSLGGVCSGGLVGIPAYNESDTSPRRDGYCCGRYASYWNAFLF